MTVSIKFCGGCNPKIDRVVIAAEIKRELLARGESVDYNNLDADFIVHVSGCPVSCSTRNSDIGKPCVVIAGPCIDGRAAGEGCLPALVLEKVVDYLKNREYPTGPA